MIENMNTLTRETGGRPATRLNSEQNNEFIIDWMLKSENELAKRTAQVASGAGLRVTRKEDNLAAAPTSHLINSLKSRLSFLNLSSKPVVTEEINCFVCNKRFFDENNQIRNADTRTGQEGMYICDNCYNMWYLTVNEPNDSYMMDTRHKSNDDDYFYFIVRKKKSRNNSPDGSIDIINIDDEDAVAKSDISKFANKEMDPSRLKKSISDIFDEAGRKLTVYNLIKDNKLYPNGKNNFNHNDDDDDNDIELF
jgi:hypothetical protein